MRASLYKEHKKLRRTVDELYEPLSTLGWTKARFKAVTTPILTKDAQLRHQLTKLQNLLIEDGWKPGEFSAYKQKLETELQTILEKKTQTRDQTLLSALDEEHQLKSKELANLMRLESATKRIENELTRIRVVIGEARLQIIRLNQLKTIQEAESAVYEPALLEDLQQELRSFDQAFSEMFTSEQAASEWSKPLEETEENKLTLDLKRE